MAHKAHKGRALRRKPETQPVIVGLVNQPVSKVTWIHRDELTANDYNPNNVPPPEFDLLRTSLMEDGWTMPLVITPDFKIVDGFHRWTLSGELAIYAMTGGLVPCVVKRAGLTVAGRMASTIRHNRARGVHHVLRMADIVAALKAEGLDEAQIMRVLGMEPEEVRRLDERGNMLKRAGGKTFGKGWVPTE